MLIRRSRRVADRAQRVAHAGLRRAKPAVGFSARLVGRVAARLQQCSAFGQVRCELLVCITAGVGRTAQSERETDARASDRSPSSRWTLNGAIGPEHAPP